MAGINQAYTCTFGDRAENEAGMQIIGTLADEGVTIDRLQNHVKPHFEALGCKATLLDLREPLLNGYIADAPAAGLLVARGGVPALFDNAPATVEAMCEEWQSMPKDKTSLMYGEVLNKHARYNNTMADFSQPPDIANGHGTVVNFAHYPLTSRLRDVLGELVAAPTPLVGELNDYFDASKCGIGFHGDAERRITVGVRLGNGANSMPLKYHWYQHGRPIGREGRVELDAGDIYFMSEKAVGNDFRMTANSLLTLRHAAGKDTCKYSRIKRKAGEDPSPVFDFTV